METFKPNRFKIDLQPLLFVVIISAIFIWLIYSGTRLPADGAAADLGGYKRIDLKALGYFYLDSERGSIDNVPAQIRKLDGQKVALDGFMFSRGGSARLHDFQLICRFDSHGPPLPQQRVFVHSPVELRYIDGECRALGTLHVRIEKNETGTITSVFRMDLDKCQEI